MPADPGDVDVVEGAAATPLVPAAEAAVAACEPLTNSESMKGVRRSDMRYGD